MLDRIRRKLFLSLKVIGGSGDSSTSDDKSGLGVGELMDILRKGSSALAGGNDDGLDLGGFLKASMEDILQVSRKREEMKDSKMKLEFGDEITCTKQEYDIEEEEKKLLSGIAMVRSRLFEGKIIRQAHRKDSNKDIAKDWQEAQKRARVDRLVYVDGIQVITDHIAPFAVRIYIDNHFLR
jgi:SWI/SNF-related matrix-associated actin-dependent regulator of chromatin subfamily A member 5